MAQSGKFDALVALGCVIRGETYHFEIVSNESSRGVTDVQLTTGIPIANAVLTVENDDQAEVRMTQKGMEAAQCAVEMANLLKALRKRQSERRPAKARQVPFSHATARASSWCRVCTSTWLAGRTRRPSSRRPNRSPVSTRHTVRSTTACWRAC